MWQALGPAVDFDYVDDGGGSPDDVSTMEVAVPDFRIPTNDGGGSSRVSVCTEKRLRQGVKSSITRHRSCQETCDRGHDIYLLAQLTERD